MCACRTPLHAAAFAEDVAGLQLVLRHGVEINAVDKTGRSALMVAADKGHSGTVGMLAKRADTCMKHSSLYSDISALKSLKQRQTVSCVM